MLSPQFINESFIDQLFNQNAVSLLITNIQPGQVEFGNGIIQGENKYFQIQKKLVSFTYQNQRKNYYQFTQSSQFTRFTMFFQNPKLQEQYYFAGIHVFPQYSFSAFIGSIKNNDHIITRQYLDMKIFNNYCLSYFLDVHKRSQNFQSQATLRICLPNYVQSNLRLRTVWKDRYLCNLKFDKQPKIEIGFAYPISNSLYFSTLYNIFFIDEITNNIAITQFTWHYKGLITKFGNLSKINRPLPIHPYFQIEMIVFKDPNVIFKCQYKNLKPSLQINFEYDSLKKS